jgi:hypothetical protein
MSAPTATRARTWLAVLKVLYLLAVTAAAFAVPAVEATRPARWYVVPGLLGLQVLLLWRVGVGFRSVLRSAWRLKWLFLVLLACYALLPDDQRRPGEAPQPFEIPGVGWTVWVNIGGLIHAALMCVQILTVLLASAVVRLTGSGTDLVDGLRALGLPRLFVHSLDQTLALLGGLRRSGEGQRRNGEASDRSQPEEALAVPPPGFFAVLGRLLRGDVAYFTQSIRGSLDWAGDQVQRESGGRLDGRLAKDVALITGVALVMASLKMLKFLPGVPFASGHKTLLFFPLYVLASQRAHTRWGGTAAGAVMGVVGFLQGDGRFGILEVLKHLAPGLLIDVLMPLVKRLPQTAPVYCVLGFLAAIARTATEFAVVLLLGARAEVYIFPAARLVPNLIAGTLSGFVTVLVLRAFPDGLPPGDQPPASAPESRAITTETTEESELVASPPLPADHGPPKEA